MSNILNSAESLIGKETGTWDCSEFVSHVYSLHGISVPHSSSQIWSQGQNGNGSAGDIVCWNGHVGICDGNGNVIHSYNDNKNIRKDSIANVSKWDKREVKGYRRF